jgi:hypothetical protein
VPLFLVGLDLGQAADFSALCLLERTDTRPATYLLRHAQRFPLATPYPEIVERVAARLLQPPLQGRTMMAVDASGVGPPVLELFRARLPRTRVVGITITGGTSVGGDSSNPTVPKRDLVSTLAVVFETERIRIAPTAIAASELRAELLAFRVSLSDSGHDSYAAYRERDHDDLVCALSLACWLGENRPFGPLRSYVPRGTGLSRDALLQQALLSRYGPGFPMGLGGQW